MFLTMEGGEGGGKSTQVNALVARLKKAGVDAIATREPGGSDDAELIRQALLKGRFERFGTKAEAVLFAAARIDHLDRTITPALDKGIWVVCDRFHDSTRVYQGAQGRVDERFIQALELVTLAGTVPDLTFILDLPAAVGLRRAARRRGETATPDRFEKEPVEFHQDLRDAFLAIAAREPSRCVVVNAAQPVEDVEQAIWDAVIHRLAPPLARPS